MTKIVALYHGNCPDGTAALACLYRYRADCNIVAVPFKYEHKIELALAPLRAHSDADEFYVLDLSFSAGLYGVIRKHWSGAITWIDHHVTGQREWQADAGAAEEGGVRMFYDVSCCAAVATWKQLAPKQSEMPMPGVLRAVNLHDLHLTGSTFMNNLATWLCDVKPCTVDRLLGFWDRAATEPAWQDLRFEIDISVDAFMTALRSVQCSASLGWLTRPGQSPVLGLHTAARDKQNVIADAKFRQYREYMRKSGAPEPQFMIFIQYIGSTHMSGILRSLDDGVDVEQIAVAFGGGGHSHAATFTCKTEDFRKCWKYSKRANDKL